MRPRAGHISLAVAVVCFVPLAVLAHTLLLNLEDNEDGTIYVEGGFSDGSTAASTPVRFEAKDGTVLWEGTLDADGCLTAEKPKVPYDVILDAGPGHAATKKGPPLTEAEGGVAEEEAPSEPLTETPEKGEGEGMALARTVAVQPPPPGPPLAAAVQGTPAWTRGTTRPPAPLQGQPGALIQGQLMAITASLIVLLAAVVFFIGWTMGRKSQS